MFLIIAVLTSVAYADSPLTSTDFYEAYLDVPVVAENVQSRMNEEIYDILQSDEYEIDVKVAVINAMGWNFSGQNNASTYMEFYQAEAGPEISEISLDYMSGEELLLLAYMVSMDDYFSMSPIEEKGAGVLGMTGVELAQAAAERVPDDFTVRLISALILSQDAMHNDWSEVFGIVDFVMKEALIRSMREEAIDNIMDYVGLYYGY